MDFIRIYGGTPLFGQVEIQGSKNCILPLIAASVLFSEEIELVGCPEISDIDEMLSIFKDIGGIWRKKDKHLFLDGSQVNDGNLSIPKENAATLRASILFMGGLAGRTGKAVMHSPGGCAIGKRPIDIHIEMMKKTGFLYHEESDFFTVQKRSVSIHTVEEYEYLIPISSVGVSENAIMAAVLGKNRRTVLKNIALEPEIVALCNMLNLGGAKIYGIGTSNLMIEGVERLGRLTFYVPRDRIVAGTYAIAGMATGGIVELVHAPFSEIQALLQVLISMGAMIEKQEDVLTVIAPKVPGKLPYLMTAPYPGFPTDLQSQMMVLLTQSLYPSVLHETIFEDRFRIVDDLKKMGADIYPDEQENRLCIRGGNKLAGCKVHAKELRGGAALVIAGEIASGMTELYNTHFIKRGYEDIVRDMKRLGANISLESE